MLNIRARGVANFHIITTTVLVGCSFWVYAQLIYRVPFVNLSHEVNLLPYFLCVIGGMLVSMRDLSRLAEKFYLMDLGDGAHLAARQTVSMALLCFSMLFATRDHRISRAFLGSFFIWSWLALTVLNTWGPRRLARTLFGKGRRLPTLFIGRVASLETLRQWISTREVLGIDPVGVLSDDPDFGANSWELPIELIGRTSELRKIISEGVVGQVILLELPATDDEARQLIEACREYGCRLLIHNNIEERYTQPLVPITEDGRHFYTLQEEPLEDPLNRLVKRSFDLVISLPVVIFVFPILCLVVFSIQFVQAPGPLFHARERRGVKGKIFSMLKFRSMYPAPADASAEAKQAETVDARIFPFGRFMRKTSLDEFPQFWNVLIGDMSIVGPRPYMPLLDEEFRKQTEGYRLRSLVKPGITGLAQSLGLRGAVLEQEMIKRRLYWDVHYITHWSIWLDIQITLRTLWQVVRPPKTAY